MKLLVALTLLASFWPASTPIEGQHVHFVTGNTLLKDCNAKAKAIDELIDASFCSGYVAGAADTSQLMKIACLPNEVLLGQAVDIVTNYLSDKPERRHYPASDEVATALQNSFPCK